MSDLSKLPARGDDGAFRVVVETPRSATIKLKYEPELRTFTMSRPLPLGLAYPYDWGFVPGTLAEDGDPLDAMVIFDGSTFPGVVLACRALGVVKVSQKKESGKGREKNDRVIAVPTEFARYADVREPSDLSKRVREEIEQFFVNVVLFTEKQVRIEGWGSAKEAMALVERAEKRFAKKG